MLPSARLFRTTFIVIIAIGFLVESLEAQNRYETISESGMIWTVARLNSNGHFGYSDSQGVYVYDGSTSNLMVQNGDNAPDGEGVMSSVTFGGLAADGTVLYSAGTANSPNGYPFSLFTTDGNNGARVVSRSETVPEGNGTFNSFQWATIGGNGTTGFLGNLANTSSAFDNSGLYIATSNGVTNLFREGGNTPNGGTNVFSMFNSGVNDLGSMAMHVTYSDGNSTESIFLGSTDGITEVMTRGDANPVRPGTIALINIGTALNNNNQVVINADLVNAGNYVNHALLRATVTGSGTTFTELAADRDATPTGNGTFDRFGFSSINDRGDVMFSANLDDTDNGSSDDQGIFAYVSGTILELVREGDMGPDGDAPITSVSGAGFNNAGQFGTRVRIGSFSAAEYAVHLTDGEETIQALREGDSFAGSTVDNVFSRGVNEFGQMFMYVETTDGRDILSLFTPEVHYRRTANGNWDDQDNWTLSINPDRVHDVVIDSPTALTVAGPAVDTSVRSLMLGGGGGDVRLQLATGVQLTVFNGVNIEAGGVLGGAGTVVGDVISQGTISPGNSPGLLAIDGDLTLGNNSVLEFELASSTSFDQILVTGDVVLDGMLDVSVLAGFQLEHGMSFNILDIGGNQSGVFTNAPQGGLVGAVGGINLFVSYLGGNGNDVVLYAVPEPNGVLLLIVACAGLTRSRRRRNGPGAV